nr:p2=kDNA-binding protein {N-terminal} [Crithidia fasciculata, Peptide Mitochondrial Kinetoplast Partial, 15 aa] [Crithidia fasciculata]
DAASATMPAAAAACT